MQAVIMAGGKGTRLASLTKGEIPKPMVPILDKPLLEWQIERLKENNVQDIIKTAWNWHKNHPSGYNDK